MKSILKTFISSHFSPSTLLILILGLTFLAYSNTLFHQFVWDDHSFILNWPQIRSFDLNFLLSGNQPEFHLGVYRPIRNLFYTLAYFFWHTQPFFYHFQAIIIHLLLTTLTFFILQKITHHHLPSLLATLIFALHPIHTEAVTWVTASFDLISFIFFLASFFYYLSTTKSSQTISYLFAFLAIFSNEISLTLPLIITTHFFLFRPQTSSPFKKLSPYYFIAAVFFLIRFSYIPHFSRQLFPWPPGHTFFLIPQLLSTYFLQLIFPFSLNTNHQFAPNLPSLFHLDYNPHLPTSIPSLTQPQTLIGMFLIILFILLFFYFRRSHPQISFSLAWFIITLTPILQFFPQPIIYAERYLYLASMSLSLLLAHLLSTCSSPLRHHATIFIILLITPIFFFTTYFRNLVWFSDITLWTKTLDQNPTSAAALNSLGAGFSNQGDKYTAILYFQAATTANPSLLFYQRNLAQHFELTHQYHQAIHIYLQILNSFPNSPNIILKLASNYHRVGETQTALDLLHQLQHQDPTNTTYTNLIRYLQSEPIPNPSSLIPKL